MKEIQSDVYWVGMIDWDLRNFHGYSTNYGSTYNAYLIIDEMPTLIDSVKDCGYDEMIKRIKDVIDPCKIKYIISNHTEMDHSGSIGRLIMEYCPDAVVVCSPKGEQHLKRHFKKEWNFKVVETGDTLNIGSRDLSFVLTPMVHWPDNMVTYCSQDKILFSNDAFGQHYASSARFSDELPRECDIVFDEAAKYYANIVLPYGNQVLKALDAVSTLSIEKICPSHGLMWRNKDDIESLLSLYKKWASYETDPRVLIVYDSMWHSTEKIAKHLCMSLEKEGVDVMKLSLQHTDISDVVTRVLESRVILFGSSILNNRMLPSVAKFLMYLKGLKPKNRYALTFGSYGWATVGFKELEEFVKDAGMELLAEGKYINFIPGSEDMMCLDSLIPLIKDKVTE